MAESVSLLKLGFLDVRPKEASARQRPTYMLSHCRLAKHCDQPSQQCSLLVYKACGFVIGTITIRGAFWWLDRVLFRAEVAKVSYLGVPKVSVVLGRFLPQVGEGTRPLVEGDEVSVLGISTRP